MLDWNIALQRDPLPLPPPAKIARLSAAVDKEIMDNVPYTSALSASITQEGKLLRVVEKNNIFPCFFWIAWLC